MRVWPITDADKFFEAFSNRWITGEEVQRRSRQAKYLYKYLQNADVDAKSFIVEDQYVDGDYLEDFASFYVSSFPPYGRYCKRIHFFNQALTQAEVEGVFSGDDPKGSKVLVDSYVGFIVARPLPQAVVGRTVLRTYGEIEDKRCYPTIREYSPCLNGISLRVKSLAFEEQDTSVAACATVALWSAFHKTHDLFGSQRPRPAAITRAANIVRSFGRAVPSGGLNAMQMGEAIRAVGLEPEYYSITPDTPAMSLIYSYVSAGIPVILGCFIEELGFHAITITGFALSAPAAAHPEVKYNRVVSRPGIRVEKLYAHDDGVGPFASLPVHATPPGILDPLGNPLNPPFALLSDWELPTAKGVRSQAYLLPDSVIVPAYAKMRVSYLAAHSLVARLMEMLEKLAPAFVAQGLDVTKVSWDIKMAIVNPFKAWLREKCWANKEARDLAGDPLPRFLWTSTMYLEDDPTLLLVSDATDTERTCPLLRTLWLDSKYRTLFEAMFSDAAIEKQWRIPLTPRFYDTLKTGQAEFLRNV